MADQANNQQPGSKNASQKQEKPAINQDLNVRQVLPEDFETAQDRYSYNGPHGDYVEDDDPDSYGPQDQFGDVDGQDPYNNLEDDEQVDESAGSENGDMGASMAGAEDLEGATPAGEGLDDLEDTLYGLAEPLAKPGDISNVGSNKNRYGTKGVQNADPA